MVPASPIPCGDSPGFSALTYTTISITIQVFMTSVTWLPSCSLWSKGWDIPLVNFSRNSAFIHEWFGLHSAKRNSWGPENSLGQNKQSGRKSLNCPPYLWLSQGCDTGCLGVPSIAAFIEGQWGRQWWDEERERGCRSRETGEKWIETREEDGILAWITQSPRVHPQY